MRDKYDVVIVGGGLAGNCLARQLAKHPKISSDTRILVAERRSHPVPESAHKVGESTVELASNYFCRVLGLKDHIEADQLPKLGLRWFFSNGDNTDITERVEVGTPVFPKVDSYQLDRGRFENYLGEENRKLGIEFEDGCSAGKVEIDRDGGHKLTLFSKGESRQIKTRWLVDASGRSSILKHKLNLDKPTGHDINAAWCRVDDRIKVDDWSEDPEWCNRTSDGCPRYLSTNHLMGRGYWVWLIPLASGATSVGVVVDADIFPLKTINRYEKMLDWLREHEPQCARVLESYDGDIMDFRAMRRCPRNCEQVFSSDRWCITGEAGVFSDPFYSPGSDLIAISNTFVTDLIVRELQDENIEERAELYNQRFLTQFEASMPYWEGQYPVMGNVDVMMGKLVWDNVSYWAFAGLMFFHDKFCDLDFMKDIGEVLWRFSALNARVQKMFIDWDKLSEDWQIEPARPYMNIFGIDFVDRIQRELESELDDEALKVRLHENLAFCESLVKHFFRRAIHSLALPLSGEEIDPYSMELKPTQAAASAAPKSERDADGPNWSALADLELHKIWPGIEEMAAAR